MYEYTNLPRIVLDGRPGGTMDFLRLPTGQWVVSAWQIRNGYPRSSIGHLLMKTYNMVSMSLFRV